MSVVTCNHCGAKLKVNPASLKYVREIPCGKCLARVPVTAEMRAAAEAGLDAPVPVAPAAAPAPADVAAVAGPPGDDLQSRLQRAEAALARLTADLAAQNKRLIEIERQLANLAKP